MPMTASIRPVRTGIIGCGNVLSAYAPALEKLRVRGAVEVIVACGRESQRASALDQTSARRFTADADEVTTAPDVDLVLILTSANNHAPLARAALEGGKHVLVEKPLAVTMEDANALVELPTRCDRHLCCAPFTLLSPTFQTMARRLRCGDIGRPCLARARYGWAGPDWTEWFYKPGGGCLFDLAVYSLTSLTGLLGPRSA
jgi:predicted dehydrogenase